MIDRLAYRVGSQLPEYDADQGLASFRIDHFLTCGYAPPKPTTQETQNAD